jgi:hypothetical protein
MTPSSRVFEPETLRLGRRLALPTINSGELSSDVVGASWSGRNFFSRRSYRAHTDGQMRDKLTVLSGRPKSACRSRLCFSLLRLLAGGDISVAVRGRGTILTASTNSLMYRYQESGISYKSYALYVCHRSMLLVLIDYSPVLDRTRWMKIVRR